MSVIQPQHLLLDALPDPIWVSILESLSLSDGLHLNASGRGLWERRETLRAALEKVRLSSTQDAHIFTKLLFPQLQMSNLCELDLASFGSNIILEAIAEAKLNHLRSIAMVGSLAVTDAGLEALSRCQACAETVQSIDITFCHNTSYDGTFCLREAFTKLKVIRRQPEWMDGRYETPFENDGLHTYYADGSFEFEREQQSAGYVIHVDQWYQDKPYFVFDKLQYSNAEAPETWPQWARYFYRPGVSLLRLNEKEVLVGQTIRGMKPPRDVPRLDHAELLPEAKKSIYLTRLGDVVDSDSMERYYMVSRMRVFPLPTLMPPASLVERNRIYCQQMRGTWLSGNRSTEAAAEETLHHALGGD